MIILSSLQSLSILLLWKVGDNHYLSIVALGIAGIYLTAKHGAFIGLWSALFILSWHELIFHIGFSMFFFVDDWLFVFSVLVPFLVFLRRDFNYRFMAISALIMVPFFLTGFANSLESQYETNLVVAGYEIMTWVGFSVLGALYL